MSSFIQIEYDNIMDLIAKFQKLNFSNLLKHENCNFVIISEDLYFGSYGGIFSQKMLNIFCTKNIPFIYDMLTPTLCIIWWEGSCEKRGDLSLCKDGFVLVTLNMYRKLKKKTIYKKIKSSYY